ncbi:hypothetical protein [Roseisolibacter agri]|uniref:Uncharacterized protein n=1 Tax=Roseisolibacter agri TaxID=2014610 RepID=A0AA37Q2E2_9BACT|nr:hypothetical protein [Roseisolibacter agri]GLC25340.1 hypothetical protein rosag_18530 [Roseisolibacter agri]
MSDRDWSLPSESSGSSTPPAALPGAGWVVGSEGRGPASGLDAGARQAARLDARLAVYAQHAAALAEQAAATLAGDHGRADALGVVRAAAAEHFAELQAAPAAMPDASFDALLSDALVELEHQAAVDLALRQRLVALRDAMSRGAAWALGEEVRAALPAPTPEPMGELSALPELVAEAVGQQDEAPVHALEGLDGGLVAVRADGVGRALAGQYPGLVMREAAAAVLAAAERAGGEPGAAGRTETQGRVDLTF